MKRLLVLPLLALPLLFLGCDSEVPGEPASVDDGALLQGTTMKGPAPTNDVKIDVRCGHGVDGSAYITIYDAGDNYLWASGTYCGGGEVHSFSSPPAKVAVTFWLAGGSGTCYANAPNPVTELPARLKCPISGKADGVASISYTK